MKKTILLLFAFAAVVFTCCNNDDGGQGRPGIKPPPDVAVGDNPVEKYGKLQVNGVQLCDEAGRPVQLRGMSTHGLQWMSKVQTKPAFQSLAEQWKCDVVRLALYIEEGGYNTNPQAFRDKVETLAGYCEEFGMYCIIDWHVMTPGNPLDEKYSATDDFFEWASETFKDKKHIIYEICNEPNGSDVTWEVVKTYADRVIPIIRKNSPESIILCGNPSFSSQLRDIVDNPLQFDNVMYTYHFYAATHTNYNNLSDYLDKLPVFVTEWGTCEANGSGNYNLVSASKWLDIMDGNNPGGQKVSWANWNFSYGTGTADNLVSASVDKGIFNDVKQPYGQFVRDKIREQSNH